MLFGRIRLGTVEMLLGVPNAWGDRLQTLTRAVRSRVGTASPVANGAAHRRHPEDVTFLLEERVRAHQPWYHTIDLGGGIVTPGLYDHRLYLAQYRLPERLDGLRVLDVATSDGFWAFEFERRGAAEVVAIDIDTDAELDLPPRIRAEMPPERLARSKGLGFELCRAALGSKVRRETLSVYDLSPKRLGTFDFVFMGDVLLHLTNPVKALQNVARVTRGSATIADAYDPSLPGQLVRYEGGSPHCIWWWLGLGALEQMVRDAGFARVELMNRIPIWPDDHDRHGRPWRWRAVFRAEP